MGVDLNIQEWKEFNITSLFDIEAGKYYGSDDYDIGNTPYVSASAENNGVSQKINLVPDFDGNKIVTGKVECKAFYQKEPFCATSDVNVFTPKFDMSDEIGMFITSVIEFNENGKWSYGRQCRVGDSKEIVLQLPIQHNADGTIYIDEKRTYSEDGYIPNWDFMENYIKQLSYKPITTSVSYNKLFSLDVDKWEEFKVSELFSSIYKAKAHTKDEVIESKKGMHFVSRTDMNNGIDILVNKEDLDGIEQGNCITIGDTTATCYYQNEEFVAGDHMVVLRANWLNNLRGLFIRTLIAQEQYRYCYGRAYKKDLIQNTVLKLPIQRDDSGNPILDAKNEYSEKGYIPDWQFMEDYIHSLPYSDRI